ncbi:MAG: MBL fold metallo-hydrolase [bacterium]|nr:MBL fold metallo-hydrolase [bacterium]
MAKGYEKVKSVYWWGLFLLAIMLALVWIAVFSLRPDNKLHVEFFDVGQGDAAFITTPQKVQVLIDGGPGTAVLPKLGKAMPFFDRTIDLVILSHPHADHLSGLIEVLKRYKVKRVLYNTTTHNSEAYKAFQKILSEKNISAIIAEAGQRIVLDEYTVLDTLFPPQAIQGQLFDDLNESSVVNRLSFGQNHLLFTGDAPKTEEQAILTAGLPVAAEVLKIGHHGSRYSTGLEFLQQIRPTYAVIPVGKNSYGHPDPATLATLESEKIDYLRTDEKGDIKFLCDGLTACVLSK